MSIMTRKPSFRTSMTQRNSPSYQKDRSHGAYTRYFSEIFELGTEEKTYQFDFTLGQDDTAGLKFLLGKAAGSPFAAHDVTIDDVKLELK